MHAAPFVLFMLVAGSVSGAAIATDSLDGVFAPSQQGRPCIGEGANETCLELPKLPEPPQPPSLGNESGEPEGNETGNQTAEPEPEPEPEPEQNETGDPHGGCPVYGLQEDGCSFIVDDQSDLALHAGGFWAWDVHETTQSIRIIIETDGLLQSDLFASYGTFMELVDGNGDVVASFEDAELHLLDGKYQYSLEISRGDAAFVEGEWTLWFEDCFMAGSYKILIESLCEDPDEPA